MTNEEILEIIEAEGVEFIRLQFTDIFGNLKNVAVPARNIDSRERICEAYSFEDATVWAYPRQVSTPRGCFSLIYSCLTASYEPAQSHCNFNIPCGIQSKRKNRL